jgi:hypothetical protein
VRRDPTASRILRQPRHARAGLGPPQRHRESSCSVAAACGGVDGRNRYRRGVVHWIFSAPEPITCWFRG